MVTKKWEFDSLFGWMYFKNNDKNMFFGWVRQSDYCSEMIQRHIYDMIMGNELDDGNIDFELLAERGDKFLSFTLFGNLNCSYLCNQMSNYKDVRIKM